MSAPDNNDDAKDDVKQNEIDERCAKEKGRDLCLYSVNEYPAASPQESAISFDFTRSTSMGQSFDFTRSTSMGQKSRKSTYAPSSDIKAKYYTNFYILSKWSGLLYDLFKNDTLNQYAKQLSDGTYIMGIPASSKAIKEVVLAVNLEQWQIKNPYQGNVEWVNPNNIKDAMDIANYLRIQDLLDKCGQIFEEYFPVNIGTKSDEFFFYKTAGNDTNYHWTKWHIGAGPLFKFSDETKAKQAAEYLMILINYLQNKDFTWSQTKFENEKYIQSLLTVFLSMDLNLVAMDRKFDLFRKYVKEKDYACNMFFKLCFATFGKNAPQQII